MVHRLCSSSDICEAIERQQKIANNNTNRLIGLHKPSTVSFRSIQITKAFVIPVKKENRITKNLRTIPNLTSYYNFFNDCENYLKTHFMSDKLDFKILTYRDQTLREYLKLKLTSKQLTDKLDPVIVKSSVLRKKMFNWMVLQRNNIIMTNEKQILDDEFAEESSLNVLRSYYYCKPKCSRCNQMCKFLINELNINQTEVFNATQIKQELKLHGHPQSRMNKRTRKQRSLEESIIELKNHYLKYH
jgi:hypothetical protein